MPFGALPIVGWWPELHVHVPSTKAGMLLAAPNIQIVTAPTAEIGWPEFFLNVLLVAPAVEMTPATTVTIG